MQGTDTSNQYFQLAVRFVNQTSRHIFLTGKAGTGKTTLLRHIQKYSPKKMVVVAPTGVAAINAGGVTMHSFFQLPFGPFIPGTRTGWNETSFNVTDQHSLFKNIRFNQARRELLRELELLVIDEVSMLRADMLDAIDTILRNFRQQPLVPFGGVQVLFIGDLFQLPPVVNQEEWESVLKHHYKSPFFFDAQVMAQAPPLYLELKKIYRQNEVAFIDILNNLRNNSTTAEDLEALHKHYLPGFMPEKDDHYITLTSHNYKADKINQHQLEQLSGNVVEFKGEVKGDFNEKSLPADMTLQMKVGAQIMFIKNDKGESRRFFNGKIGTIGSIAPDKIVVRFPNEEGELEVEKETWRNIRYSYNRERDEIEEEELGTFKQYPIRLAWAITIHKSQGLTFDRAIIDAGASFAPGQVYVALSRLTTMEGLVLFSRIHPHCISTDERVITFTQNEMGEDELHNQLQAESKGFISKCILQSFDWVKLTALVEAFYEDYLHRTIAERNLAILWGNKLLEQVKQQQIVAAKFMRQLEGLLHTVETDGYESLQQRIQAATDYFIKDIDQALDALQKHINTWKPKPRVKKYMGELQELKQVYLRRRQSLEQVLAIGEALVQGAGANDVLQLMEEQVKAVVTVEPDTNETDKLAKAKKADAKKGDPKKGETKLISLQMFKEGKSLEQIARERSMTTGTIESHLCGFIFTGEVDIKEMVSEKKIAMILATLEEVGGHSSSPVKEKLGAEYSYTEIKAVIQYRNRMQASGGK